MTNAFPEECPDCGTESAESSSMGVWCDPCGEWFDPEAAEAAGEAVTEIHGPQLPTDADVKAAEASAAERRAETVALCDLVDQPNRAEWVGQLQREQEAEWDARQGADSACYLNWVREADASSPATYRARAEAEPEAGSMTDREYPPGRPATALEAWEAIQAGGLGNPESRAVIASYLAPGPTARYDTPADRAKAEADRAGLEAGG